MTFAVSAGSDPSTGPADSPAESGASAAGGTRGLVGRPLALSPSRAADFKQCPLLYRYRAIDRFPETPTKAQTRGTVVHAALENLFDMPAALRTRESADFLVEGAWAAMCEADPSLADVIGADGHEAFLTEAHKLIENYYGMENPTAFDAAAVEEHVELETGNVRMRGFIDRIDIAPTGEIRVVDYKTGRAPGEAYEAKALFQMKFYALAILRLRGVVPHRLQLMYLSDGQVLTYEPDRDELERFGRTLAAIWQAIRQAVATGDFRPQKSWMCRTCEHRSRCPEFGGEIPEYPGPPPGFTL
ncbi:RecB family exonuclease [Gordonia desulfuricans]|uniref:RecB family exonuclease n=1 Tax=Gordonia desulfuricans TaxID=89051 RepID=A0A7K3LM87_9ACTN|nr:MULTISPECIES: RecB family exonuclease [Gordonia]EMP15404.1 recombinase RecB [Gordonia sp. NB41Y]NDK89360.1 RecB family exonuclease [Gordonia desulfuricans]WLP90882.1 RecB family exonuclease [Gordonia sp. NB41Y]